MWRMDKREGDLGMWPKGRVSKNKDSNALTSQEKDWKVRIHPGSLLRGLAPSYLCHQAENKGEGLLACRNPQRACEPLGVSVLCLELVLYAGANLGQG